MSALLFHSHRKNGLREFLAQRDLLTSEAFRSLRLAAKQFDLSKCLGISILKPHLKVNLEIRVFIADYGLGDVLSEEVIDFLGLEIVSGDRVLIWRHVGLLIVIQHVVLNDIRVLLTLESFLQVSCLHMHVAQALSMC